MTQSTKKQKRFAVKFALFSLACVAALGLYRILSFLQIDASEEYIYRELFFLIIAILFIIWGLFWLLRNK